MARELKRLEWRMHDIGGHLRAALEITLEGCEILTRLQDLHWENGSIIPLDPADYMARIGIGESHPDRVRLEHLAEKVLHRFFKRTRKGWINESLLEERREAEERVRKCAKSGAKGGASKKIPIAKRSLDGSSKEASNAKRTLEEKPDAKRSLSTEQNLSISSPTPPSRDRDSEDRLAVEARKNGQRHIRGILDTLGASRDGTPES